MSSKRRARLSYEESYWLLQRLGRVEDGPVLPLPNRRPRFDDDLTHGVRFFRTWVGSGSPYGLRASSPEDEGGGLGEHDLENLTLPRTYFGRSEISYISFRNTDLSESTLCWNDFIEVDFTDADLSGSDLRASIFKRTSFVRADLRDADLRHSTFRECNFTGADLCGAKLTRARGQDLVLSGEQKRVIDWQEGEGEQPDGG